MDNNSIKSKLRSIIANYVEDESLLNDISPETELIRDLNVNSIHLVDILLDLEEEFDIEITDDEAAEMTTVGGTMDLLKNKID